LNTAVVGGGWAGLAAALELSRAGRRVTVYEAAKELGGRARGVEWRGITLDNGQHLMVGAYREVLRLADICGTRDRLERRPLELIGPGFRLRLPRLPAPLHLALGLLLARGLGPGDKLAAVRFMRSLKATRFRLPRDLPADELLARYRQPPALVERLWGPICVATLNTPLESASAQVFCHVLRDSLAGTRGDSDLVFNRTDLGRLLPRAAADAIAGQGGEIRLTCKVQGLHREAGGYRLAGLDAVSDEVVLAVHPARLPALLAGLPELAEVAAGVAGYAWQPILTCWLLFERDPPFPFPMLALAAGSQSPWAFERSDLAPGLVGIVVSADGPHVRQPREALLDRYLAGLERALGPLPPLRAWKTIVEKRATYACVPGMYRPGHRTPLPGLWLAGDYTRGDYPATLEGAVRSGVKCARLMMEMP
jgi:hydroxysqualene dehydroxylase